MSVRVVIPRSVLTAQVRRIRKEAQRRGYNSRVVAAVAPRGWVRLEFLVTVYSKQPGVLEAFEIELDDMLLSLSTPSRTGDPRTSFSGSGSWIEPA
ncbi:MAG: hypothetical protein JWM51_560 [Microbacteriaceae bacterium]|jgi:hypothetical protein|nr:hypothetical protein [Microbacteriaceae bacterium]